MEKQRRKIRTSLKVKEPQTTSIPEVMDIPALSKYLGMGKSKIYALIRLKKIPASRIGRQYRFSKSVIDSWLKEKLITHVDDTQMPLSFGQNRENPVKEEAPKEELSQPSEGSHASS